MEATVKVGVLERVFLCMRVAPGRYRRAIVQRLLACSCQADVRITAQGEVVTLPVNGDALDPALRAALGNGQVQCPIVPVKARFRDGFDSSGC